LIFGGLSPVAQKLRNIDYWAGFHFAAATIPNAQDQLYYHVRAETDGF